MANAVILAGGKSSRMGRDKALLPFGGYSTLAEYQYRRLSTLFEQVYISSKEDKFDFEAPLIFDKEKSSSPLLATASIFETIKDDFFLIAVDMPLLDIESIKKLLKLYREQPESAVYLFESAEGLEPTAAIYRQRCYKTLLEQLRAGRHSMRECIAKEPYHALQIESENAFLNTNYKSEYLKALEIYAKEGFRS